MNDCLTADEQKRISSGLVTPFLYKPNKNQPVFMRKVDEIEIEPYGKGCFVIGSNYKLLFYPYERDFQSVDQYDSAISKRVAIYLLRFDFIYQAVAQKLGVPLVNKGVFWKEPEVDFIRHRNNYRGGFLEGNHSKESFEFYQEKQHAILMKQMDNLLNAPALARLVKHVLLKKESLRMNKILLRTRKTKAYCGRLGAWIPARSLPSPKLRGPREN